MKLIKVTNAKGYTSCETLWRAGAEHVANKSLPAKLCTRGVIHAFRTIEQAYEYYKYYSADFLASRCVWEAEGAIAVEDKEKVGCRRLRVLREITGQAGILRKTEKKGINPRHDEAENAGWKYFESQQGWDFYRDSPSDSRKERILYINQVKGTWIIRWAWRSDLGISPINSGLEKDPVPGGRKGRVNGR